MGELLPTFFVIPGFALTVAKFVEASLDTPKAYILFWRKLKL